MNREVKKMKDVVKIHQVGTRGTLSGMCSMVLEDGGGGWGVHVEHIVYVFYGGGGWGGCNCEGGAST
jgi:hypothetical protein